MARAALEQWLPRHGLAYRWEPRLGGFRKVAPNSANHALRHAGFRDYADHMATTEFFEALDRLVDEAAERCVATMCSESLWWRCHRRLVADALVLSRDVAVSHLMHDGRIVPHRLTEGVRAPERPRGAPVYDGGQPALT